MAYASDFNVKHKKRDMIKERIDTDPMLARGMRVSKVALLLLLLLRVILFIVETVYFGASNLKVDVVSNLLLIPMLFILYMIYDGNKGLAGVLAIFAIVRVIYLFSAVYPTLPTDSGAGIFVGLYLFVMAFQFVAIILMTAYTPCVKYFEKMQGINMELGVMLRAGGATASKTSNHTQSKSKKRKKK